MRHCNNPECRLPITSIPDGNWGDRFCSKWCQRHAARLRYAMRKKPTKPLGRKRYERKQEIAKTPNQHTPFPLTNRSGGARSYLRTRPFDRKPGQLRFTCNSQEFKNLERLQHALGTNNVPDAIRYCLNAVYASLVRRNKIDGYPQLNLTHPRQEQSHEENR